LLTNIELLWIYPHTANVSNKLVDSGIKIAPAKKTPYKLFDGEGMYLLVTPAGQKYWRLKYRFTGKERTLYSLAVARLISQSVKTPCFIAYTG